MFDPRDPHALAAYFYGALLGKAGVGNTPDPNKAYDLAAGFLQAGQRFDNPAALVPDAPPARPVRRDGGHSAKAPTPQRVVQNVPQISAADVNKAILLEHLAKIKAQKEAAAPTQDAATQDATTQDPAPQG